MLGVISWAHNFKTKTEILSSPTDFVFLRFRTIPMTSFSLTGVNSNGSFIVLVFSWTKGIFGNLFARLLSTLAKKLLKLFAVLSHLQSLL